MPDSVYVREISRMGILPSQLRKAGTVRTEQQTSPISEHHVERDNSFYMQLFQDMFNREDKRRNDLDAHLSFPVAVIALLVGAALYCLQVSLASSDLLLRLISMASLIASACSAILIAIAYHGQWVYACLPLADDISRHISDLECWWKEKTGTETASTVKSETGGLMAHYYCRCATINSRVNDRRSAWFARARLALVTAVIFLLICAVPCYHLEMVKAAQTHKTDVLKGGVHGYVYGGHELSSPTNATTNVSTSSSTGKHADIRSNSAKTGSAGDKADEASTVQRNARQRQ